MAQENNLFVANGSGLGVRTAINNALEAIATNNSGNNPPVYGETVNGVAPTSPADYQFWVDTSSVPAILKIYQPGTGGSAGNWHQVCSVEAANRDPVTQGFATHNGDVFEITGNGALGLPNGTTAQRDSANVRAGAIRWNTDLERVEVYDGAAWGEVTEAPVASLSITSDKLADSAVTRTKIAPDVIPNRGFYYPTGFGRQNTYSLCPRTVLLTDQTITTGTTTTGNWGRSARSGSIANGHEIINTLVNERLNTQHRLAITASGNPEDYGIFLHHGVGNCHSYGNHLSNHVALSKDGNAYVWGYYHASYPRSNTVHAPVGNTATAGDVSPARLMVVRDPKMTSDASSLNRPGYLSDTALAGLGADQVNAYEYGNPVGSLGVTGMPQRTTYDSQGADVGPGAHSVPFDHQPSFSANWRLVDAHTDGINYFAIDNAGNAYASGPQSDNVHGERGNAGYPRAMRPLAFYDWHDYRTNSWVKPNSAPVNYNYFPRILQLVSSRMDETVAGYSTNHSAGFTFYARSEHGFLYSWGSNSSGQLGNGTTTDNNRPLPVEFSFDGVYDNDVPQYTSIAYVHSTGGATASTFAIGVTGDIYVWGNNEQGQLGTGTTNNESRPVYLQGIAGHPFEGKSVIHVICVGTYSNDTNYAHTYFLLDDGSVWACGRSEANGKYTGVYSTTSDRNILLPERVTNSFENGLTPTAGGTGFNDYVPLGLDSGDQGRIQKLFTVGGRYTSVFLVGFRGRNYSSDVRSYIVYSFGNNATGQLGRGATTDPTPSTPGTTFAAPIEYQDFGVSKYQTTGGNGPDDTVNNKGAFKFAPGFNSSVAEQNQIMGYPVSITGYVERAGTEGYVVLIDQGGHVFVTGGRTGAHNPRLILNIVPENDLYWNETTGASSHYLDRFTQNTSLPEQIRDCVWYTIDNCVFIGWSDTPYYCGQFDSTQFYGLRTAASTDAAYLRPLTMFQS